MKTPIEPGEAEALRAGEEAPLCWICDHPILDVSNIAHTTRGEPLCPQCAKEIDDRAAAHAKGVPAALESILKGERHL